MVVCHAYITEGENERETEICVSDSMYCKWEYIATELIEDASIKDGALVRTGIMMFHWQTKTFKMNQFKFSVKDGKATHIGRNIEN